SKNCLKIARVDIEPARDDHVLLSIHQDQEPILVEAADIPRANEALSACVKPFGCGRLLWPLVVALHDHWRMPHQFANFTARHFLPVLIDEPYIVSSTGLPTVCSLFGCRCAARKHTPPPSVRPYASVSPPGHLFKTSAFNATSNGALVDAFIKKLDKSYRSKSGSAMIQRYWTGTSIAFVARCCAARRKN